MRDARLNAAGIHQRENFGEHFHAAMQRFFQQFAFGKNQPVLRDRRAKRAFQNLFGARLRQKPENRAFIHRVDRRLNIRVPCQRQPNRIGSPFQHGTQKLRTVHPRHPHVRNNHRERTLLRHRLQSLLAPDRRNNAKFLPQHSLQPLQHIRLVIND